MQLYTFDKSFQERMDEFLLVLDDCGSIKEAWKDFLETLIEPAGYKAVWKISKGMCEMLDIKFPAEVFGEVKNTYFDSLSVDFMIEQVQDEDIHLPEVCQAPIEDIFPTIYQENNCLNVEQTADYFDRYRFFYNYIFLPFDSDNDKDWPSKTLEDRVNLFYDLKNKKLSKGISSYIRHIISEVKYIQFKRDVLANSIDDQDSSINEMKKSSKEVVASLLDLHLKMNKIKHEIEILVNPEMREAYELIKFGCKLQCNKQTFVITKSGTISEQIGLLEKLKEKISSDTTITWMKRLCDAISCSSNDSEIYIPGGRHIFSFLDYLNNNLLLCGTEKLPLDLKAVENDEKYSIVSSADMSAVLFFIDGDMKFENLIVDCTNVKTGFSIKSGSVLLKNCHIIGLESNCAEAFNVSGDSCVILDNCAVRNFGTGFSVKDTAKIELSNCKIENCSSGIDIHGSDAKMTLKDTSIVDFGTSGIVRYLDHENKKFKNVIDVNNREELNRFNINLSGDNKFIGNTTNTIKIISKLNKIDVIEISDEEAMDT